MTDTVFEILYDLPEYFFLRSACHLQSVKRFGIGQYQRHITKPPDKVEIQESTDAMCLSDISFPVVDFLFVGSHVVYHRIAVFYHCIVILPHTGDICVLRTVCEVT